MPELKSQRSYMEHCVGAPDLRWQVADQYASEDRHPDGSLDDRTREAAEYLRMIRRGKKRRKSAKNKFPIIAAACELIRNKSTEEVFKLAILGDLPKAEICSRLDVDLAVLETAQALFFDIEGKRKATSWMTCRVFLPAQKDGDVDIAAKMKLVFFGGPIIARAVLDAKENLPLKEAQRLVDQETLLHAKLQSALEYRLTEANSLAFVKVFMDYDLSRKKLDFAREKFQYKCEVSRRQYEAEHSLSQQSDDAPDDDQQMETSVDSPAFDDEGDIARMVA